MNVNYVGRGGVLTALLGFFIYLIMGCLYVLFYAFIGAVFITLLIFKGIQLLYRHRKARKLARTMAEQPLPVMNPVNPRNWTPPAE